MLARVPEFNPKCGTHNGDETRYRSPLVRLWRRSTYRASIRPSILKQCSWFATVAFRVKDLGDGPNDL